MSAQMISRRLATALIAAVFLLLLPASAVADEFGGTWVSASVTADPVVCPIEGSCPFLPTWSATDPNAFSTTTSSWNYNEYVDVPFAPLGTLETATFTASGQEGNPNTYALGAKIFMGVTNWGSLNNSYQGPEDLSASAQAELWLSDPSFVYDGINGAPGPNGLPQNGYLALTLQFAGSGVFVLDYYNQYDSHLPGSVGFNSNPGTATVYVPFSLCDPVIQICGSPDIELALNVLVFADLSWREQNLTFSESNDYFDTATVESAAVYTGYDPYTNTATGLVPGATFDGLPNTPSTVPEPGSWLLVLTLLAGLGMVYRLHLRRA
jgi:hypothetical protein